MKLLVVLVLALLGTASAHGLLKALEPVVLEGSALEEETELELGVLELQCPLEQKNMMTVTDESGRKFYYKIVPKPRTFERAQTECKSLYSGQMASIHSAALNKQLHNLSRTHTLRQVWIGGITSSLGGKMTSRWVDGTTWNFSSGDFESPTKLWKTPIDGSR